MKIITRRRENLGLSLSEVARRTGIPKSTLSRYESLERQFPLQKVQSIANVLGLEPDYLLGLSSPTLSDKPHKVSDEDLERMLEGAEAYGGSPMTDNDKNIIKGLIESYLQNKPKDGADK